MSNKIETKPTVVRKREKQTKRKRPAEKNHGQINFIAIIKPFLLLFRQFQTLCLHIMSC